MLRDFELATTSASSGKFSDPPLATKNMKMLPTWKEDKEIVCCYLDLVEIYITNKW